MLAKDLTFGVEIECYVPIDGPALAQRLNSAGIPAIFIRHSHQTTAGWKVVHDASVTQYAPSGFHGLEVVSPILIGEAGLERVTKVADLLRALGSRITTKCGLHVHVGARNANPHQLKTLGKMFVKYEKQFDALVPASRRETSPAPYLAQRNRFACSNSARFNDMADAFRQIDAARTVAQIATVMNGGYSSDQYTNFRYFKLNYQSMATHGTVEFRQHSGSVESQKICAWIKLVTNFVASAMSVRSVAQADGQFDALIGKVDRPTAAYLESRRAALVGAA